MQSEVCEIIVMCLVDPSIHPHILPERLPSLLIIHTTPRVSCQESLNTHHLNCWNKCPHSAMVLFNVTFLTWLYPNSEELMMSASFMAPCLSSQRRGQQLQLCDVHTAIHSLHYKAHGPRGDLIITMWHPVSQSLHWYRQHEKVSGIYGVVKELVRSPASPHCRIIWIFLGGSLLKGWINKNA